MAKIWRYPITPGANELRMPTGAEVVHVGVARGETSLWALVTPSAPDERRRFLAVGTGETVDDDRRYLGTFEFEPGFVYHLFE